VLLSNFNHINSLEKTQCSEQSNKIAPEGLQLLKDEVDGPALKEIKSFNNIGESMIRILVSCMQQYCYLCFVTSSLETLLSFR